MNFVDLFAGIGGFRLAAAKVTARKLNAVGSCEIDADCRAVYERSFGRGEFWVNDVQDIRAGGRGSESLPGFDLLLAGFPCQAFSNVGRRLGFDDERGQLFFEIVRILRSYRPRFFVLENVQKISTIGRGEALAAVRAALEDAGYVVDVWDLYANHYGLPQQRRRMFFCGVSTKVTRARTPVPPPPRVPVEKWKYPTAWHLLERHMHEKHLVPAKTRKTVLRKNPRWMGDLQIDRAIARPICASMAKWHRANQDNYYSRAYVIGGGENPYEPPAVDLLDEPIRRITPLEGFRLQGFPDQFARYVEDEGLKFTSTYRLIGNAVPVDLAAHVIDHFLKARL